MPVGGISGLGNDQASRSLRFTKEARVGSRRQRHRERGIEAVPVPRWVPDGQVIPSGMKIGLEMIDD